MKRIMMGLLASLACIAGLLTATAQPASATIYPVVTNQWCLNDPGPLLSSGTLKYCVGVKWQRNTDGSGYKVTQMYLKKSGSNGWFEPTAITSLDFNGYTCNGVTSLQACVDAEYKAHAPISSKPRSNMNYTYYPSTIFKDDSRNTGLITFEGDFRVNNAADYHMAIVVEFGVGSPNVPWGGAACDSLNGAFDSCQGIWYTSS